MEEAILQFGGYIFGETPRETRLNHLLLVLQAKRKPAREIVLGIVGISVGTSHKQIRALV